MHRIDESLDLLLNNEKVQMLVNRLVDYVEFISKIEKEMSKLNLETKSGLYMAGVLDSQRREKHDIAIASLMELNEIAQRELGKPIYTGSFDDNYRNEIAQAIMIYSNHILDI